MSLGCQPGSAPARTQELVPPGEREHYAYNALLGVVYLLDCLKEGDTWTWLLDGPQLFPRPIPWPGRPHLFDVPDEVVADLLQPLSEHPSEQHPLFPAGRGTSPTYS
jgi:hypothetical protein